MLLVLQIISGILLGALFLWAIQNKNSRATLIIIIVFVLFGAFIAYEINLILDATLIGKHKIYLILSLIGLSVIMVIFWFFLVRIERNENKKDK